MNEAARLALPGAGLTTPYPDAMTGDLTTRGTPRKRFSKQVRREQLLDVAEKLFVEHGYSGVTMEDIRLAAGVSRPVLYDHFPTREVAFIACVERARHDYDTQLLQGFDLGLDIHGHLRRGAALYFDLLEADPGRWRLMFGSSAALPVSHMDELAELRFGTIRAIEELLHRLAPEDSARELKFAAHAISGVGERLGLLWLDEPDLAKQDLIDQFVEFVWSGIRAHFEVRDG